MLQGYFGHLVWLRRWAGGLMLVAAAALGFFDAIQSDDAIIRAFEQRLSADFAEVEAETRLGTPPATANSCKLLYAPNGSLLHWTNNAFLPPVAAIAQRDTATASRLSLRKRLYYQVQQTTRRHQTAVWLIPIWIDYPIHNRYLEPYIFLGRYAADFSAEEKSEIAVSAVSTSFTPLCIRDAQGKAAFFLGNIPASALRQQSRQWVVGLGFLGILCWIWEFALRLKRRFRERAAGWLLLGAILVRVLCLLIHFPNIYLHTELFSKDVFYINELIPSLGDLLLHVLLAGVAIQIGTNALLARAYSRRKNLILSAMLGGTALILAGGYWIGAENIIHQSAIPISFENIFQANPYALLLLLCAGYALMAIAQTAIAGYWLFARWRTHAWIPRPAYRLPVYLLLLLLVSLVATHTVTRATEQRQRNEVAFVARQVLGERNTETAAAFAQAQVAMQRDSVLIAAQFSAVANPDIFLRWLTNTYLEPNLPEFTLAAFMYDDAGTRLDHSPQQPQQPDGESLSLTTMGEYITEQLYRTPSFKDKYGDSYTARFSLMAENYRRLDFLLELTAPPLRRESLYPALTLREDIYKKEHIISEYEYAVYADSLLYAQTGISGFPLHLRQWRSAAATPYHRQGEYMEYFEANTDRRAILIRHQARSWFALLTTFSFIFYCFSVPILIAVYVPQLMRYLRRRRTRMQLPIRGRIRVALLALSFVPMLLILVFLSPVIRERYYRQAYDDLNAETERIAAMLTEEYVHLHKTTAPAQDSLLQQFKQQVAQLGASLKNDINIYNEAGRLITATQMNLFDAGITTECLNVSVFDSLRSGKLSGIIVEERIGKLTYLSGYHPIQGGSMYPIGYVNVPYLAKQDRLNAQMMDFLAYLANTYLLIFLLISVITIFISNALTRPLAVIQARLASIRLGGNNQPITYHAHDEIGEIVNAYNHMVAQLAESEQQLMRSQREAAWQQMAQQVAHEIKNPLTPMRLSVQLLMRSWEENSEKFSRSFLKTMQTLLVQIDSLTQIANSFSAFAKMPEAIRSHFDLRDVVSQVAELYAHTTDEVQWELCLPEQSVMLYADRDQLSRAINNLVKNALQAMEDRPVRQLTIRLFSTDGKSDSAHLLSIADTGCGMDDEVKHRAFEPKFSTKTSGMGLGLAIVRKIVESSGGRIDFDSTPNVGTVFTLVFPATTA